MKTASLLRVRGIVQGVGFRPFVYRLARAYGVTGWVLNGEDGVTIHAECEPLALAAFIEDLELKAPPAARIAEIEVQSTTADGSSNFAIRESRRKDQPTVHISPDLPVCEDCLRELFDAENPRYLYPYINCTNCGPRYSVILSLPYDRPATTMSAWLFDEFCGGEYRDPANRRFHAQPIACSRCGPNYVLRHEGRELRGIAAIRETAALLRSGAIVAVKGLGGYHLACDAGNSASVWAMRERKFRKEKPFALMVRNIELAHTLTQLDPEAEQLLNSIARPIVLAKARMQLQGVAPDNDELGLMLPYTPIEHLLFDAGAPDVLVMTSANRSNEPIAYQDEDALQRLAGIADAFLIGERPIARRVDDSVARAGVFGPVVLRRARGFAPAAVATLPARGPILALGADLKNSITLVVDSQAFMSQHIGDLDHQDARRAYRETIRDLLFMYGVQWEDLIVVHDAHPQYVSTQYALTLPAPEICAVQHHRAHVASVLAERGEMNKPVLGISFDGTGYGDDGAIWGGEFFAGSVSEGFERVAHLRPAVLPGGDAATRFPVQAASGFLAQVDCWPDFAAAPFKFPTLYRHAARLVERNFRCSLTTSVGRLFDTAAALLGFTRKVTFEGQAAMWLECLAAQAQVAEPYPFPFINPELDFRPLLGAVISDRLGGRPVHAIARGFQKGIAVGVHDAAAQLCDQLRLDTVVLSGGVFQNELLLSDLKSLFSQSGLDVWTNHQVPPNDGGISLGQSALAIFAVQAINQQGAQADQMPVAL